VKTIKRKISATLLTAQVIVFAIGCACTTANASVFEQLAAVANSALPTYGRVQSASYHPELRQDQIDLAIRQAMRLGSDRAVYRVVQAVEGGLPLSSDLRRARRGAVKLGHEADFIRFEQQLQGAVMEAVPVTAELFKAALVRVEFVEPRMLLLSHDTAMADYLRHRVAGALKRQLEPVVTELLQKSGAIDNGSAIAEQIQFGKLLNISATDHVVQQSIDGFFRQLESEEHAIRYYPEYRSTRLLRRAFR